MLRKIHKVAESTKILLLQLITKGFKPQSRKNRGCLSLISNMRNQFSAIWAVLEKLPKKIKL